MNHLRGFTPTPQRALIPPCGKAAGARLVWGFTLIETLLYALIVSVVIGAMMLVLFSMLENRQTATSRLELTDTVSFVEQKLTWAIRGATSISLPAAGAKGSILVLTRDVNGTPTQLTFDLNNHAIRMQRGSADPVPLTNDWVSVASLGFETYSYSTNVGEYIRVKSTLASTAAEHVATQSFDFFVTTR